MTEDDRFMDDASHQAADATVCIHSCIHFLATMIGHGKHEAVRENYLDLGAAIQQIETLLALLEQIDGRRKLAS